MSETKIQVNGKDFVLQFGMKFFRLLSEKWNVPGIQAVIARLSVLETMTDDVTFEQIDVINDLILASVTANAQNEQTLTAEELDELFLYDSAAMTATVEKVVKGLMDSMPKPKPEGKPKAGKK